MRRVGAEREKRLRGFLGLENGIPSHDTFRRFWRNLAPARLDACFLAWVGTWAAAPAGDTIHLDGKCLRRAYGEDGRRPCIVSAHSSLDVDPERALQAARSHWDVENPPHWVLDMIFDEDHSRARSGFSAENLAIMRHMAYNATRKSEATKGGMKRRKKSLTWNPDKLLATLRAA